ncbi:DEAD/DEAH box helicase [uncultured Tissierella sp.]|uniref:DEAD/DEAH box helicase n=1 Tax=uncultured Tissierella sp. TaxID=448160 RepID=UPI00280620BA|nr:DEAD/DEAH box helicase [uncultured Tissierella sp.]MDU5081598.1 DEAD/DEAH box helicase [Bacillota bacterium]
MTNNFKILGISKELEKVLERDGITRPTPIQEQAIPQLLKGKDVIAQAHTGTGKTFAFMLPIMETIDITKPCIQALIIAPTRELAIQITNEAKKLTQAKNISILAVYGGQDVERQLRKLNKGVNIVIGTPGRLLDHMRRKSIDLGQVKMIVLDEADEMLNMGFLKDVEEIIYKTSKTRQTMLFSATMPKQLRSLAVRYMKEPVQIQIQSEKVTLDEIKQVVIETTDRGKQDALCSVIDEERPFMAIIFCRTKRRVKALNSDLRNRGYNSDEIHGDLSQAKREKVINSFRDMKLQFLVATDVAGRGLDIEGITHIFNYDIPEDAESYIHRIGRTGRAGETGKAFTFVTPRDQQDLISIENKIRMNLKKRKIVKDNVKGKTNRNNSNEQINKKQDFRWNKDSGKKKTIRSIEKRKGKKK